MLKQSVHYLVCLVVIGISIIIYMNTLTHEFVNFDDRGLVIRNYYIKTLSMQNIKTIFTPGKVGAYQPVRTLSYAVDYYFWKLNPTGYHLTNILCHALNVLLVYWIVYLLTTRMMVASLASLLFAVHPIHVEAVAWVAGRRDVLSTMFALAAFLTFIWGFPPGKARHKAKPVWRIAFWYVLSLTLFVCGLLSKQSVVILPCLFVLYDVCFLPSIRTHWRRSLAYIPFFLTAFMITRAFLAVARSSGMVETSYHGSNAYFRFLTMTRVFAEYIVMLFVPRKLSATYGITLMQSMTEPAFLVSFAVLLLVAIVTIIAWKGSKIAFFGIGWFCISLIPVANIIPIAIVKADRYLYFPSVGFSLLLGWLLAKGWKRLSGFQSSPSGKRLVGIGYWLMIGLLLFSYALYTHQRNQDWRDSHTLWTATLETNPDSSIALNNLGLIYTEQGMPDKAIALYERLVTLHPDQEHIERVYRNMAEAYMQMQNYDEAIDHYQHALEIDPEYLDAYLGLGRISQESGQYAEAERIYRIALEIDEESEAAFIHLGNLYTLQKRYDDALQAFTDALAINPSSLNAQNGIGLSYAWKGDTEQAISLFREVLQRVPDAAIIRNSLGSLYMEQGETELAIAEFSASLDLEPENINVRHNLGMLYLRLQRYPEAAREFITCLHYQPDSPKIISNLGNTYVYLGLPDEAIQMYQWAIELDPTLFRTVVYLGDICMGTGRTDCAIDAYRRALTLQPDQQEVADKLQSAIRQQQEAQQETE